MPADNAPSTTEVLVVGNSGSSIPVEPPMVVSTSCDAPVDTAQSTGDSSKEITSVECTPSRSVSKTNALKPILSPISKALSKAVKDTVTPPQDTLTKKAMDNKKNTVRMKRLQSEIITSEDAIKAL